MKAISPDKQLEMCTEIIVANVRTRTLEVKQIISMIQDVSCTLRQWYGWDNGTASREQQFECCQRIAIAYTEQHSSKFLVAPMIAAIASKLREFYGWEE